MIFDCHEYTQRRKVALVFLEFTDYAIVSGGINYVHKRDEMEKTNGRAVERWRESRGVDLCQSITKERCIKLFKSFNKAVTAWKTITKMHMLMICDDIRED
ncbi:unnamed protein product [Linum trigynum]|uniref:Uncharacterized protein n=1 Tax=Linum trigynum TaxID=586398 RepID=A0AAV2GTT3_9ROSI